MEKVKNKKMDKLCLTIYITGIINIEGFSKNRR